MGKAILNVSLVAFFFSCTNYVPVSALVSPLGFLLIPVSLSYKKSPKFLYYLFLFFLISIVSVAIYDPQALLKYEFFRYDGNFIVSYSPLFLIPLISSKSDTKKILIFFLYFETLLNFIAFVITFIFNHFTVSADLSFGSLFIARNAAGGFLSFCITIAFLLYWENKSKLFMFLLIVNVFFLMATYSRGSILGVGFSIVLFLFFEKSMGKLGIMAIVVGLIFEIFLVSKTYNIYKELSTQRNGFDAVVESLDTSQDIKSANVTIRLLYAWPSGIDEFLHSPLFGAGFGSVNDRPYIFDSPFGIINANKQPVKIYNDAHAHNTYFHIAGEQGIVGFSVFFIFLSSLYIFFSKNELIKKRYPLARNVILLYILNLSIMSLTEHRLTTPSNVLPFTLLILIFFADYNFIKRQKLIISN